MLIVSVSVLRWGTEQRESGIPRLQPWGGFNNATAFSPTDTMPLSAWAKLLMMIQSLASLLTVALVVSRAVNILK